MSEHDGGGSVAETQALSPAERAELEALRAEIVKLRERPERAPRHRMSWRTPVATLLIVIGCLLAPLSVLGVWPANQGSDTSRYIANVTPLISQPPIQHALTDKITNAIVAQINVPSLTSQATTLLTQKGLNRVATLLQGLSGPLNSAVAGYIHGQVAKIISGPRMANAWVQVNQAAHQEIVAALSGRTNGNGAITVSNGQVTVGLAPFIDIAKQDLAARGLTIVNKLPSINPTFALFPSKDLVKAQTAYRLINDLKIVLPILSLLLIAVGVYIARGHRRALIGARLGFAASMLVLAAGLAIARGICLNSVRSNVLPGAAAAAAFDVLVRFIKPALRTLLVVGLVVAAAAFLTGPSVTATATRRAFSSGLGWIRRGGETHCVRTRPGGAWTFAHRRGLRIGAVGRRAAPFVFHARPTPPPL